MPYAWVFLIIFPLSESAYVLFSSIFFTSEAVIYAFNIVFNFIMGYTLPTVIFNIIAARFCPELIQVLIHIFSVIPSFSAIYGLYSILMYL